MEPDGGRDKNKDNEILLGKTAVLNLSKRGDTDG